MVKVQLQTNLTKRQSMAWDALDDPRVRRILFGGAKGGGKSYFLVVWLFTMVWAIMVQAKLQPSKNPPHIAWFGRKQATDLTGTTLQTWREVIPEQYYSLHGATEKDPKHILIADRVAIDYGGLDKQENINKFNSAEYIIIAIDQAEEVTRDEVSTVLASLRMILKGPDDKPLKIPFKELYTANPRQCWLREEFILNPRENSRFIPALPTDNPHLPTDYIRTLEEAFGHRPELLKAYKDGDWSAIEGADQVIKESWLRAAKDRMATERVHKRYLVCDTARYGDDECPIFQMDNAEIEKQVILPYCNHDQIASRLAMMSAQNNDCPIVVESIGSDIGAAVITDLMGMKKHVIEYTPQGKSQYPEKFYNVRAEAWHIASKVLSDGIFDRITNCPVICKNMDDKTRGQLCTPSYDFRGGRILVESKKKIKERLGNSPDRGDTYVIALWAWHKINAKPVSDRDRERNRQRALGPMSM
ncbi:hypothetical protein LCGC14_0400290 [marine sediment metagenome]|uniref:Phage terminase large subunit N-terminal domain-containing protein n=1 Tax=marine sediment metagenome TaxID=412755 RepID=A0A0F9T2K0_9ZZZZ